MNPTLQTILSRRSIRNYQPQQISDEQLEAILQAGLFAPSAMNEQAWKLAVVQNPKTLVQLADAAMAVTGRDSNPFYNAPTLIVVFVKKDAIAPFSDGALCLGNMMNAAASLGLGSCWSHCAIDLFADEKGNPFRQQWQIDPQYQAVGSCIVGLPAETPQVKPRVENSVVYVR